MTEDTLAFRLRYHQETFYLQKAYLALKQLDKTECKRCLERAAKARP